MVKGASASFFTELKEARRYRINLFGVELVEFASAVNQHGALEGLFRERIVADSVVGKVVNDFEGEEIARCGDKGIPGEYGAVDDLDVSGVASCGGRALE